MLLGLVALVVPACATRIHGGVYTDSDGGYINPYLIDLAVPPDLRPPPDLAPPPPAVDLAVAGKSCGQIVQCAIGCGLMLGGCQLMCFQGGSPKGQQEATTLLACAARSCLLGGGSDGGANNLLLCVISKCANEVAACEGFGFGGA